MTTTVTFQTSPVYEFTATGGFYVGTGNNLVGTKVTTHWDDGTNETATFVDSGGTRGDAIGTGWRLYLDGNDGPFAGVVSPQAPYSADVWNFVFEGRTAALTSMVIDSEQSSTYAMFDADHGTLPPGHTPGSGGGITWEVFSGLSGTDIGVTYSKCLKRTVDTVPYEDLYLKITLEFSGTAVTSNFSFFQDHDYASTAFTPPTPTSVTRRHVKIHA